MNGEFICPKMGVLCEKKYCAVVKRLFDESSELIEELREVFGEVSGRILQSTICLRQREEGLEQIMKTHQDEGERDTAFGALIILNIMAESAETLPKTDQ